MDIVKIAGLCIVVAAIMILLRQQSPQTAVGVGIVVTVIVFSAITPYIKASLDFLEALSAESGAVLPILPVIKAMGIAFIGAVASDICKDSGEGAIGGHVELAAKVAILVIALPMAGELIGLFRRILG